jgi:hypothetical protein
MVEVKTHCDHPASMEQRIADRLRNSGGEDADHHVVHGTGPTRTHTNIHLRGNVHQRGPDNKGEGSIDNKPRGSANPHGEI